MILPAPMFITARLEAGLKLDDAGVLSVFHIGGDCFGYRIEDAERNELEEGRDLRCPLYTDFGDPMRSLLSFLSAAAEAVAYDLRGQFDRSENGDLFSQPVMDWAYQHSEAIDMALYDFGEG